MTKNKITKIVLRIIPTIGVAFFGIAVVSMFFSIWGSN